MAAIMIPGGPVAEAVLDDVAKRVASLRDAGVTVGLATVLVGDDPASAGYVRKKHETCEAVGMASFDVRIPASATQADLLAEIARLNADPAVHGFIVQNPVPAGFDFNAAMAAVDPAKDADGLHPTNLGFLALGVRDTPRPCTPLGIVAMLAHYEVPVAGRHAVIVGRGPTLGRPLSMMLALKEPGANAAVTVVHTGVPDWRDLTKQADIVVGATGVPNMITPDVIKPGAAVIGGGMTWEGRKVLSDIDESCAEVAGWITPRLGGVGVTTVAMLLRNTVLAAERAAGA
ncbi:bifunctional 5,10-methylenetetrahydrofolate dehydrogenase/5,10-methenyltetrahydrofolate cyclohydrolase [Acidiferrimicrobium sp. IK]|uniref:bifunctional 5,10-methylenetetrahydrofolate dehydrogenase/5,10-methenyltetrahydrofolate cyclohydrolase n=1 Tax=Acidiferrimicrobium sp. IK TaxID=2871700 RepID=UPI0021CB6E0B|nr:tetrahydrofolate dehydrogenase/cyclohydrolase catalytic domain-containing protein [Acidiferrimicrobium sp. IK]MCU4185050.1 bifunctional 5,10-methylenetetrahydrofolate dehydrogenase/5,10-methenyltetrahydrofolate cyclohydrolase [Acidiferrimicrobium sp. IK]